MFHKKLGMDNNLDFTAEALRALRSRREAPEYFTLPVSAFPQRSQRLCGEIRTVFPRMKLVLFAFE